MNFENVKNTLAANPKKAIIFTLPNGETVPVSFHITDIGVVKRHLIDCGGQTRTEERVHFQLWTGKDYDHRVTTDTAHHILKQSQSVIDKIKDPKTAEVLVEYQLDWHEIPVFSLFTIGDIQANDTKVNILLSTIQTSCLAAERSNSECGISEGCCG
ncbi:MAG: hypothetical protein KAG28_07960 [Cocleimonas sp.]|nr:hypothetical protein [Cocleimonas sp.]